MSKIKRNLHCSAKEIFLNLTPQLFYHTYTSTLVELGTISFTKRYCLGLDSGENACLTEGCKLVFIDK